MHTVVVEKDGLEGFSKEKVRNVMEELLGDKAKLIDSKEFIEMEE